VGRSSLIGTFWGVGHTASLLAVGLIVIVSRRAVPARLAEWMELAVAFMLVFLGVRTLRQVWRQGWKLHIHEHEHDGHRHVHLHAHTPDSAKHATHVPLRFGLRPFLIGTVHGLAGSGALMLLVLGTIPSAFGRLAYIATFGVGSIGGMLAMSALISLPFVFTAIRFEKVNRVIQLGAGTLSTVFGVLLIWQNGVATHLLG